MDFVLEIESGDGYDGHLSPSLPGPQQDDIEFES